MALFNQRDWDGLRALLADDVRLRQSSHPLRTGVADVGMFFSIYSRSETVHLVPGWLEGREVIVNRMVDYHEQVSDLHKVSSVATAQ